MLNLSPINALLKVAIGLRCSGLEKNGGRWLSNTDLHKDLLKIRITHSQLAI